MICLWRVLSLILLLPAHLLAGYGLSIGAIFQNESPYLREWIEFHKLQGVEHFFLYNNLSEDDFGAVLRPYIETAEVTLIDWPYTFTAGKTSEWDSIQCRARMDCIKRCDSEWVAFIDIDEFLFCCNGQPLVRFLENYQAFGGLVVNSVYFGTSGVEEIPPGFLMIELLTTAGALDDRSLFSVKSIVQPQHVQTCTQPHTFLYKEGFFAVDALYNPVLGKEASSILINTIRLNHYWTRTERFFREKKRELRKRFRNEDEQFLKNWYNQYTIRTDTAILQFVPALKKSLF